MIDIAQRRSNNEDVEKGQDLHTLDMTDNMDVLFDDIQTQLSEINSIIDKEVEEFFSEYDVPEGRESVSLEANLEGRRDSGVTIFEKDLDGEGNMTRGNDLQDIKREWENTGPGNRTGSFDPLEYEELFYLEEGEIALIEVDGEKYQIGETSETEGYEIESVGSSNENFEEFAVDRVSIESSDPIYMEEGAEFRIEGEEVDYIPKKVCGALDLETGESKTISAEEGEYTFEADLVKEGEAVVIVNGDIGSYEEGDTILEEDDTEIYLHSAYITENGDGYGDIDLGVVCK